MEGARRVTDQPLDLTHKGTRGMGWRKLRRLIHQRCRRSTRRYRSQDPHPDSHVHPTTIPTPCAHQITLSLACSMCVLAYGP